MGTILCASCGAEADVASNGCPKCEGPQLLAEKYRLTAVLGRGANGITYRAERTTDGAVFAVKEMPLRTLESAKAMELFEREARVLRQLDHRAIPRYEDDFVFGEGKNAALHLVQELVSGETLADEAEKKRYEAKEVWAIVAELAEVLDYLHRRSPPVVHRDVKPKNVMRRDDGRLVLIDFGSVRDALTRGGGSTVAGTFGYMAPEQLAGKATPASDVYALGALAVALLTRKEPDTLLGDDHRIHVREHVDADEDALVLLERMLDPNPAKRPQRAGDVFERARALARSAERASSPRKLTSKEKREERRRKHDEDRKANAERQRERVKKDREKAREEAAAEAGQASENLKAERSANRTVAVTIGASLLLAGGIFAWTFHSAATKTTKIAATTVGSPELYARPIAIDVNGDGIEDMVAVMEIDGGPHARNDDDGEDTWGKENGRFEPFVQVIDGKDGALIHSIKLGGYYTSLGNEAKSSERVVLVARGAKLGVTRITPNGHAKLTIHDLATGKEQKSLAFDQASGAACETESGTFSFSGTIVDLERGTATPGAATCVAGSAWVADVPAGEITDRTAWSPRFSREAKVERGAYVGRTVVERDGLGVFVADANVAEKPPTTITISVDNGGGQPSAYDNTKTEVVGVDMPAGTKRFARSLYSLGFTRESVDHVEVTPAGALLFFKGTSGLALLDAKTGEKKWALALPRGSRLSSYTLSSTRAYLHVFGPDPAIYGFLSKKLESRILVADLAKGTWIRAVPEGSLAPEPPAATVYAYDPKSFPPVSGCSCVPRAPAGPDGGLTKSDGGSGGGSAIELGMYTRSWSESGGRKTFGVNYSLAIDGVGFGLPHYLERRQQIAPPPFLEGEVPLGVACGEDAIVFAADRVVTAWSLSKKDELWTVELPTSRGERRTILGGAAALTCTFGRIERGRVYIPSSTGPEVVLSLVDGAAIAASTKR